MVGHSLGCSFIQITIIRVVSLQREVILFQSLRNKLSSLRQELLVTAYIHSCQVLWQAAVVAKICMELVDIDDAAILCSTALALHILNIAQIISRSFLANLDINLGLGVDVVSYLIIIGAC